MAHDTNLAAAVQTAEGDATRLLATASLAALRAVDALGDPDAALEARDLAASLARAALVAAAPTLHPAHSGLAEVVEAFDDPDADDTEIASLLEDAVGWVPA